MKERAFARFPRSLLEVNYWLPPKIGHLGYLVHLYIMLKARSKQMLISKALLLAVSYHRLSMISRSQEAGNMCESKYPPPQKKKKHARLALAVDSLLAVCCNVLWSLFTGFIEKVVGFLGPGGVRAVCAQNGALRA